MSRPGLLEALHNLGKRLEESLGGRLDRIDGRLEQLEARIVRSTNNHLSHAGSGSRVSQLSQGRSRIAGSPRFRVGADSQNSSTTLIAADSEPGSITATDHLQDSREEDSTEVPMRRNFTKSKDGSPVSIHGDEGISSNARLHVRISQKSEVVSVPQRIINVDDEDLHIAIADIDDVDVEALSEYNGSIPLQDSASVDNHHEAEVANRRFVGYVSEKSDAVDIADPEREGSSSWTGGVPLFELRGEWMNIRTEGIDSIVVRNRPEIELMRGNSMEAFSRRVKDRPIKFVIRPTSSLRFACDIAALVFLMLDLLMTPFQLAFDPPSNDIILLLFWVSLTFWTMDIPRNYITGYFVDGVEELRLPKVAWLYTRTWLPFDLLVVATDWTFLFVGVSARGAAMARTTKMLKILRVMRLVRLAKLRAILETIQDRFGSEFFIIGVTMVKLILLVVFLNHFIACIWYGMSVSVEDGEPAWVQDGHFVTLDTTAYKYFTALHWSLTQFTPASMEVFPMNTGERAFAVTVLLFALLVFSSFLSSITTAMTQMRQLFSWFNPQISMLRRYLRYKQVSKSLTIRILRYVEHVLALQKQEVQEKDVILLRLLSKPLEMELKHNLFQNILVEHPFFNFVSIHSSDCMSTVCNTSLTSLNFSVGDTIFAPETSADSMFFVLRGHIRYRSVHAKTKRNQDFEAGGANTMDLSSIPQTRGEILKGFGNKRYDFLKENQWCCEAALWTPWMHMGYMRTVENTDVLAVDARSLLASFQKHRRVLHSAAKYGRLFVQHLNEVASTPGRFLSDLIELGVESELAADAFETGTEAGSKEEEEGPRDQWAGRTNGARSPRVSASSSRFSPMP